MRVISQDGSLDFPYEKSIVFIPRDTSEVRIVAIGSNDEGMLAEYSTEEKAKKAMEMLRETYIGMPIVMQNVDVSENMAKEFERLKKCGVVVRADNQPSKVEFINNAVFQFPQDEEIEV